MIWVWIKPTAGRYATDFQIPLGFALIALKSYFMMSGNTLQILLVCPSAEG